MNSLSKKLAGAALGAGVVAGAVPSAGAAPIEMKFDARINEIVGNPVGIQPGDMIKFSVVIPDGVTDTAPNIRVVSLPNLPASFEFNHTQLNATLDLGASATSANDAFSGILKVDGQELASFIIGDNDSSLFPNPNELTIAGLIDGITSIKSGIPSSFSNDAFYTPDPDNYGFGAVQTVNVSTVPEPSAAFVVAAGAGALLARRRREAIAAPVDAPSYEV